MLGLGGLGGLTRPMPLRGENGSPSPSAAPMPAPPASFSGAPAMAAAPASTGAPSDSPLGMWQNWLSTMGPYLAQTPTSQPRAESGGLSSLSSSAATNRGPWQGDWGDNPAGFGGRGFRFLQ